MFTIEQKVDLVMRYVTTVDQYKRIELKRQLIAALKDDEGTDVGTYTEEVEKISVELLKKIGMPPHLTGHDYTLQAIQLCTLNPSYLRGYVTKCLYPDIAKEFDTTPSRVERCIRHAIEVVFFRGNTSAVVEIFGNVTHIKSGKLSNSEFFAACANEITRQLKERGIAKEGCYLLYTF